MSKNKHKRKGRAKFLMIEGYIIRSSAWKALTPNDRAAYLELKWRYDGLNNGRIGLGCRELASALGFKSPNTASICLSNLQEKGFIARAKASGFSVKNRVATEWRLTEHACNVTGELPTKDFTRWAPDEKSTGLCPEGWCKSADPRIGSGLQTATAGSLMVGLSVMRASVSRLM